MCICIYIHVCLKKDDELGTWTSIWRDYSLIILQKLLAYMTKKIRFDFPCLRKNYVFLFRIFWWKKKIRLQPVVFVRAVHGRLKILLQDSRSIPSKMWRCLQIKRCKIPDGSNRRWNHLRGCGFPSFETEPSLTCICIYKNGYVCVCVRNR